MPSICISSCHPYNCPPRFSHNPIACVRTVSLSMPLPGGEKAASLSVGALTGLGGRDCLLYTSDAADDVSWV